MADLIGNVRDFFQYIHQTIDNIFDYFNNLLSLTGYIKGYLSVVLNVLPGWLYVFMGILIAVCILYKFLGREGNA